MEKYYEPPEISQIPDIKLYMDQMIEYLELRLAPLKWEGDKAIITKTMVNNYVKAGLIEKPEKKKYSKSQIMDLMMACHFKNVLSIEEIAELFRIKEKFALKDEFYASYRNACLKMEGADLGDWAARDDWQNIIKSIIMSDYYKRMAKRSLKDKCLSGKD